MTVRVIAQLIWIAVVCTGCADSSEPQDQPSASLVLTNGEIKTPDGWAEAIAISDGEIVAVGDSSAVSRYVGEQTEVVDLAGYTVLPGFHDPHVHPLFGGMMYSEADHTNCNIVQGSSTDQLIQTLRDCVSRVAEGEWVTGGQWDASALGGVPDRSVLDAVSPDTPVIINDTSGHSAWANSNALQIAGIDRNTPDPEGGIIERDLGGVPTGILRESAIGLVRVHVPPPSDAVIREALTWSLDTMMSYPSLDVMMAAQ